MKHICPNCKTEFSVTKQRLESNKLFCCCSLFCSNKMKSILYTKKKYPYILGPCENCEKDIIIKNSSFDKKGRRFCSKSCSLSFRNKNRIYTNEQRKKIGIRMSKFHLGKKKTLKHRKKMSINNKGNKSHFWRGGLTEKNRKLRNSLQYKIWRDSVYKRDNWTCTKCSDKSKKGNTVILNADHIKPWSKYPKLRFDINNGRTLCLACHKKTPTFARKNIKKGS